MSKDIEWKEVHFPGGKTIRVPVNFVESAIPVRVDGAIAIEPSTLKFVIKSLSTIQKHSDEARLYIEHHAEYNEDVEVCRELTIALDNLSWLNEVLEELGDVMTQIGAGIVVTKPSDNQERAR